MFDTFIEWKSTLDLIENSDILNNNENIKVELLQILWKKNLKRFTN